ncbi:MAG: dihydrolipoyl dehydrogenase [Firmicutes bacterium]|nr:dihydrolipoyl dehydrogenase [Bacillota bacterium]
MCTQSYDVVVIGGGPGGYTAAAKASALGGNVALIEKKVLGGTCLNQGCIPTKTLLKSTEVLATIKKAKEFGIDVGAPELKPEKLIKRKNSIIKRLNTGVNHLMKSANVTVIAGEGKIIGQNEVVVSGNNERTVIKAGKIIIASGSEPANLPGIKTDGVNIINSNQALEVSDVPSELLIIGGGAIGVEFAGIFNKLGSKVTLVEAFSRILPFADEEASSTLKQLLTREKINILTDAKVAEVNAAEDGQVVKIDTPKGEKELKVDKILVAVGRRPNGEQMAEEDLGLAVERGRIVVNSKMETNISGIYAIGDVTGGILLAHVASTEGIVAAVNAMGSEKDIDYSVVPSCIYTSPELASVGLSESQAAQQGINVVIGKSQFIGSGKAVTMGENKGLVKIVAEADTGKILGMHIVGPQATSLIGEGALAVKLGATVEDIADTIHAHPSLPETIMEAAENALQNWRVTN